MTTVEAVLSCGYDAYALCHDMLTIAPPPLTVVSFKQHCVICMSVKETYFFLITLSFR